MKRLWFLLCFLSPILIVKSQVLRPPTHLRCDFLSYTHVVSGRGIEVNVPIEAALKNSNYQFANICNPHPVFTWQVDTSVKRVTGYHILVASSGELLTKNIGDYWDSKKISLGATEVVYAGKPMQRGHIYYWKVCVWTQTHQKTPFSEMKSFFFDGDSNKISHYPLAGAFQEPQTVIQKEDGSWFVDFGKDAFGQLQLNLTSDKNDSIWIEAGEALANKNEILKTNGNIRYIRQALLVEKGTHDYNIVWPSNEKRNHRNSPILMPGYIGEVFPFRYVAIENFSESLGKISVRRKVIYYPFNDGASAFTSSDSVLNKVWDLCKYSEKATSFTGYYVDGDRERVPYEADALINQLSHYVVDPEYTMARRSMAYVIYHPTWPTEWSLQNILLAWNDFMYTDDDSFLKKYYTELQKKLLMPLAGSNGLISTRTGKQTSGFLESIHFPKSFDDKDGLRDNVDWPHGSHYVGNEKEYDGEQDGFVFNDYNAVVNAYYYRALVLMKKIALVLQKNSDVKFYTEKAKQVYNSFQEVFKNEATGLIKDGDSTTHTSLHANMFALAFGLVAKNDIEKVIGFIKTRKMACSVYGAQFLLDALYDNGEGAYALTLLDATTQRSWYNMIRSGSTITMEAWDKVYKPNLDWNHAWGAAPANIIVRDLMGIEPLTPGFETFQIKPQPGNLSFVELKTPTVKGEIFVSYRKASKADKIGVIIPGGTVANIYLPFNTKKPVLIVDGNKLDVKPSGGYFIVESVQAGKHTLIMQ